MYNNITEFREFIANASDKEIERAILYINVLGLLEGTRHVVYDDKFLIKYAIDFAKSGYNTVSEFINAKVTPVC